MVEEEIDRREQLRKSLKLSSLDNTFDNFKPVKGTEKALKAFKDLVSFETEWKMLLCYGGVGNGKTHLCEATSIELYKKGMFCRVMTMPKMMHTLKQTMDDDSTISFDELLTMWSEADYLIMDDVGMGGSGTAWEYGQLEVIVVTRYRDRLFTILTTNRDITELPERITSRFRDPAVGRIVLNEGADFRKR